MKWNISSDRPIYQQLVEQVTERIVSGFYVPGEKFPAVRELASDAGVNPNTMQRALSDLERNGLLYSQRTNGRFITEDTAMIEQVKTQIAQGRIQDFLGSMLLLGFQEGEIIILLQNALLATKEVSQ